LNGRDRDDEDLLRKVDGLLGNNPGLQNMFRDVNDVLQSDLAQQFTTLTDEEKRNAETMAKDIGRFIDQKGWPEKYGDKAILNMFMSMQRATLLVMKKKMQNQLR